MAGAQHTYALARAPSVPRPPRPDRARRPRAARGLRADRGDWQPLQGDALTYHVEGRYLAEGEGFRRVFEDVPTAEFPPAQIVLLAAANLVGLDGVPGQRLLMCVVGAVTVALIGLLGRLVGGTERMGLVAAAIAAVYPPLWIMNSTLLAESLYGALLVAFLIAAAVAARRRSPAAFAVAGAVLGLTVLARGEALALLVLVVLPLAVRARSVRAGAAAAVACVLVLAPWTARNLATFERPVALTNNIGGLVQGSNCRPTYFGDAIGSWRFDCYGTRPPGDESEQATEYRRRGLAFLADNTGRLPLVVAARLGRLYELYRPWDQGVFFSAAEGRHPRAARLAVVAFWLIVPLALAGVVLLRRAGRPLLVVIAPIVLVTLVGAATYGSTRFRYAAEPSIVVLAAAAVARVRAPG
jgi:hypothetical protein